MTLEDASDVGVRIVGRTSDDSDVASLPSHNGERRRGTCCEILGVSAIAAISSSAGKSWHDILPGAVEVTGKTADQ